MKNISIIIPAYNEEKSIESLIKNVKTLDIDKEIIVVNDGSTDDTEKIIKNISDIKTILHPYNKGNGAAVKTGILASSNENIIIIDADGQHNPEDVVKLIEELDNYDLVVGARTIDSDTEGIRDLGNYIFKKLGSYLTGIKIPDMTSGFRAFKKQHILRFFNLYPNGFSFPTTSTMCFLTTGLNVKFISIKSKKRAKGSISKIKPLRDGFKFILIILRIIMLNPLKIFLTAGGFFFFVGILWSFKTILNTGGFSAGGLLFLISGINLIFFGFIFDQIVALRKDFIQKDLLLK